MIQEDKLIKQLNDLREINPSHDFVNRSKGILLSTPRPQKHFWVINSFKFSAKESVGFALSVGLVAGFIIIFLNITPQTVSPILGINSPSAANTDLLNQANAAVNDINIHLAEVNTFDAAADETSNALTNINPSLLKAENNTISSSTTNSSYEGSDIDTVLDELTQPQ